MDDFQVTRITVIQVLSECYPSALSGLHFLTMIALRPMTFLSELAANASERNVGVLIYSGNDDSLVSHRSSEGVS